MISFTKPGPGTAMHKWPIVRESATMLERAAQCTLLIMLTGCSRTEASSSENAGCLIARVGSDDVTIQDADTLRAIIQAPLARAEASRLAVAVTVDYRATYAWGPLPKIDRRLALYRLSKEHHPGTSVISPGFCWAGSAY